MADIYFEKAKGYKIADDKVVKVTRFDNGDIKVKGSKNTQSNLSDYRKLNKDEYMDKKTGEIKKYKKTKDRKASIKNSMKNLKDIIRNNFTGGTNELFITLTCEELINDYNIVCELARKLFTKLKKIYKGLEYVFVMEQQARESWHVHAWVKDTQHKKLFIDNEEIAQLWGKGNTKTKRVNKTDKDVNNINNYMTKTKGKEKIPAGKQAYGKSRGIKVPETNKTTYGKYKSTLKEDTTLQNDIALHIKSKKTGKIIATHFEQDWKEGETK